MHEAGLVRDLLRRIEALARAERARRVTAITVRLGALSHMSPEHFTEHFREAARGTLAETARLRIEISDDPADPDALHVRLEDVELDV